MKGDVSTLMDENIRRYYLDTMGIQCWQLADVEASVQRPEPQQQVDETGGPAIERLAEQAESDMERPDWPSFEKAVKLCEQCTLRTSAREPAIGAGGRSSDIMFVLLAPAADGTFLTAQAKALFVKMLAAINISIDDVYITALLKCPVPANHTISPKEVQSCRQHLEQQVRMVAPRQLVVLGETAARCLLQKNQTLDQLRDLYNQSQKPFENTLLFLSYSPDELLLRVEDKRKAWADLQQLQALIGN